MLFLFVVFVGCASIFPKPIPISLNNATLTQDKDELLLNISFNGNDIYKELKAHLTVIDITGASLYDKDFTIFKRDFKQNPIRVERGIKIERNVPFAYAKLSLELVNGTEIIEIGQVKSTFSGVDVETIAHETQYAIHIRFRDTNSKPIEKNTNVSIKINDSERILYQEIEQIKKSDFKNGKVILLLPYEKVKKSFYDKGSLIITAQLDNKAFEKSVDLPLKTYTSEERKEIEEELFSNNSKLINNKISYVGFDFFVMRAGIVAAHTPNLEEFVRVDAKLKNPKNNPAYLVRDDFYLKDSKKAFYPVFARKSTAFGPLLKPLEQVNASFYFKIFNKNDSYLFYYGDKALAEVD